MVCGSLSVRQCGSWVRQLRKAPVSSVPDGWLLVSRIQPMRRPKFIYSYINVGVNRCTLEWKAASTTCTAAIDPQPRTHPSVSGCNNHWLVE